MDININWAYAKGVLKTEEMGLTAVEARGRRMFGEDEIDAALCVSEQMLQIALIHTGDVDSSNALCKEIARRWNHFEEWYDAREKLPEPLVLVNVRFSDGSYNTCYVGSDGSWKDHKAPTHWTPIK